jgi:hypothetical protein
MSLVNVNVACECDVYMNVDIYGLIVWMNLLYVLNRGN